MRIGIDAHNLEGDRTGVGRYLLNLVFEWNKSCLEKDVKFVLYFRKSVPQDLNQLNAFFEKKVLSSSSDTFFRHWLLPQAASRDKIDVLFCPGYVAPVFYKRPIALAVHDIIYEARPDLYNWQYFGEKILLKRFSRISIKKAGVIFAPSKFTRDEILKHYSAKPEKILKINLAADDSFKPMQNEDDAKRIREKYHIKDKFVFYLGSIFNRRHLPEVISAFEAVAKNLHQYQLVIVGANHTAPLVDIEEMIKEVNNRLAREAILHVKCSNRDLPVLYAASDLFIYLSDYEGFGLPVLEALSCGVPVVTSRSSSLPEVAGEAAIYVKNNSDVKEIETALRQGLIDENLRQNLIKQGLAQAGKFSWAKCAQETLTAILNLGGSAN